jgi:hypothetical protein
MESSSSVNSRAGVVSLAALLIRSLHQTGEWTIQSRVMAQWRNALDTLVSPFTDCAQIKLFVMAVTKYSIPAPTVNTRATTLIAEKNHGRADECEVNQFTLPLKAARQCGNQRDRKDLARRFNGCPHEQPNAQTNVPR